jgi:tellurite resistance protein
LRHAERNLTQLAALRKKCIAVANADGSSDESGDELGDEIIKLLHLPTEA